MIIDDDCDDTIRVCLSQKLHVNVLFLSLKCALAQLDWVITLFTATAETMLVKIEQPGVCSAPARNSRSALCVCVNRRHIL